LLKRVYRPWGRIGMVLFVSLALVAALYFEKDTMAHILGVVLAVAAWFATASFFPERVSDYSTIQKIVFILITLIIIILTLFLF
jgi:hypothetical protein